MMITRCPACGTMFNVVSDQLKVSQGWVRCGNCSDVFDASIHLQDEGSFEALPEQPIELADATVNQIIPPAEVDAQLSEPAFNDDFERSLHEAIQASALAKETISEPEPAQPADLPEPAIAKPASDASRLTLNDEIEAEESAAAADSVSFVKEARRQAFWKKKWVRIILLASALCLMLALVLQVLIQQKNYVVVLVPQLKPFIQSVCEPLGCELAPLRRIDAVVIDSSTFTKISPDNYKLNFSLKNLATVPLAMPSLEVTLTDTQDQPLLRRVLLPAQFGAVTVLLTPGVDFAGSIALNVSAAAAPRNSNAAGSRVAGYRLLAFYP